MTTADEFKSRLFVAYTHAALREGRRITQERFAEMVSEQLGEPVTQAAVSRWMSGAIPDAAVIQAIAQASGVTAGWLLFGEGDGPPGYVQASPTVRVAKKRKRS